VRSLALVLAVAACGGAQRHDDKPKRAVYLALFERGRAWSLPIELVDGHHDARTDAYAADTTSRGSARCAVSDVRALPGAKVATLLCARPYNDLLIDGPWVATATGLYHPAIAPDTADDLAAYGEADALIGPDNAEHHGDAQQVAQSTSTSEAFEQDGAWCVRATTAAGRARRSYTLCFDARGISGGGELEIDGADQHWHRVKLGKAPADPDDPTAAP